MNKVLFTLLISLLLVNYCSSYYYPISPPILSNKFLLSFDYACRTGVCLSSCKGQVMWNGQVIYSINPCDHAVHNYKVWVYVKTGQNKLQFQGAGQSDSYGLTIDNVKVVRYGNYENIAVNGGFE